MMNIEILEESRFLHVVGSGEFSLAEAKRTFIEILKALNCNPAKKVLFDCRKVNGNPEVMERFYYGEFAGASLRKYEGYCNINALDATQFAYVLNYPLRDPNRLGELAASGQGMFVRTFDTIEDAILWLNVK